jgi:hypothetical protein
MNKSLIAYFLVLTLLVILASIAIGSDLRTTVIRVIVWNIGFGLGILWNRRSR